MRSSAVRNKWLELPFSYLFLLCWPEFRAMNRRWFFGIFRPDPQMGVRLRENDKYRINQDGTATLGQNERQDRFAARFISRRFKHLRCLCSGR
jgi:hypothetical protein